MAANKGLGKGLGALLGESAMQPSTQQSPLLLPLQKIEPNRLQPRKSFNEEELASLADSIRQHGVIQPLTVRLLDTGYYQIIAGERRWRAARMAGLREVPVVIIEADDKKAMELALIENLQRADLTPIEEARGYQQLIGEYGLTQEQVADRVSKSRPAVANAMRLLSLPDELLSMVESGKLTAGHARALLSIKDERQQLAVAQKVVNLQLSVRQTEAMCKKLLKAEQKPEPKPVEVDYLAECEKALTRCLGRGVKIVSGKRKGKIELEYYGQEDLQRLYEALSGSLGKEQP
mgnify:FL=1